MANPAFIYRPPQSPYLEFLYQDNDIVVANKPSGLLSVPGKAPEHYDSLISRINCVFPTATVVHRLDMATSGVIVLALNKPAHRHLSRQFETRQTRKRYFAHVWGSIPDDKGEIDLPLICDWPNRPKQKVDFDSGKPAVTRYEVIQRCENRTLVALYPITGRSHQLRVHMLSLGHPILGDRLYGSEQSRQAATRLQLHANVLQLRHPVTNQLHSFESPLPFSHFTPPPLALNEQA
ncbi:bifunctional tRNA pseudouridine(32) synthase/23S rRNA pseudouridine(746) synthase RluA [Alteromonas sp. ASW11-130]|uniref:bifunctional tRNA pseudouridine(32) synthase/23S rRNA pseudouridine(746) synthase RluA n=1 Tax=Alteromonas sp. ASW11-130 TaxID=3015775 RepID=UPI0022423382|nr:bifunctional tRNA pseudouridine(32) synthase/23S rRNA pseudouridine(746) synthase RluA [Alteromonas sp. ASW11-130]MCW8091845.1 bifunctional tRNA pseudouridine(32) synthase/23S rRNA pseudouridine(746) synthase RluA [Alteromonas sp. ASW11-130]